MTDEMKQHLFDALAELALDASVSYDEAMGRLREAMFKAALKRTKCIGKGHPASVLPGTSKSEAARLLGVHRNRFNDSKKTERFRRVNYAMGEGTIATRRHAKSNVVCMAPVQLDSRRRKTVASTNSHGEVLVGADNRDVEVCGREISSTVGSHRG